MISTIFRKDEVVHYGADAGAPVKRNGGLHVIMRMFSPSERVQDQGFGRGARQGEPGSAQAIVCFDEIPWTQCQLEGGIECLKAERNREEHESLERR